MDASEDPDVLLQKTSSNLIEELQSSFPRFLYAHEATNSKAVARLFVRKSTTVELVGLLEPFQEWPQLLDPHLASLIAPLTDAFLQCMTRALEGQQSVPETLDGLVIPVKSAVCKLLYTICKIRGPKVVTRFLPNEARYLEPMLNSLHAAAGQSDDVTRSKVTWEERFIHLLWISHLTMTPFDLSTVGSSSKAIDSSIRCGLDLPADMPVIAQRLIHEAISHLASPSKEREAAVKLLVRLCLRFDMLKLGLHVTLVKWSIAELQNNFGDGGSDAAALYTCIGCLSFMSGLIASADATIMFPFLLHIFQHVRPLTSPDTLAQNAFTSAVTRKAMIKVFRAIALAGIQVDALPNFCSFSISEFVLEDTIDYILTSLGDKDTPVRYAASKALSTITIKLQPHLAAEVTEAVVIALHENVLWEEPIRSKVSPIFDIPNHDLPKIRNLTTVNPLRWHGLTLALAQLLFQRSPFPSQLPPILNALITALSFEQRTSSGTSLGANVRDAANFGIWSLARRYSTQELAAVDTSRITSSFGAAIGPSQTRSCSVTELLATELIVAASLDPAGNIRRGSSAALQELIGRHPDVVTNGISLVQTVDYHAVSLRQRAFENVATTAAQLHTLYWEALIDQLLGWRGINAADAKSRRMAARSIGLLSCQRGISGWKMASQIVWKNLARTNRQDAEGRHGLLLALRAIIDASQSLELDAVAASRVRQHVSRFSAYLGQESPLKDKDLILTTLRPELTAEAVCSYITCIAQLVHQGLAEDFAEETAERCLTLITIALGRREELVISCASTAAKCLVQISPERRQVEVVKTWIAQTVTSSSGVGDDHTRTGPLSALGAVFPALTSSSTGSLQSNVLKAILSTLPPCSYSLSTETRTPALSSLNICVSHILHDTPDNREHNFERLEETIAEVVNTLKACLQDYTTDQRGDIGSWVRLAAIDVVETALQVDSILEWGDIQDLIGLVATLAAEKLDKVRLRAWKCLQSVWPRHGNADLQLSCDFVDVGHVSTTAYFEQLALLSNKVDWLTQPILRGIITSAGTGSESVLRAARAALATTLIQLATTEKSALARYANAYLTMFRGTHTHERLAVPSLETLAFLLQTGALKSLKESDFAWRALFVLVQKAHFKSGNVARLTAAVEVYTGLSGVSALRKDMLKKLASLLLHPLPRVRNAAADALYLRTREASMETVDWSKSPKELKASVERLRETIGVM